jgi:hypothetical protein
MKMPELASPCGQRNARLSAFPDGCRHATGAGGRWRRVAGVVANVSSVTSLRRMPTPAPWRSGRDRPAWPAGHAPAWYGPLRRSVWPQGARATRTTPRSDPLSGSLTCRAIHGHQRQPRPTSGTGLTRPLPARWATQRPAEPPDAGPSCVRAICPVAGEHGNSWDNEPRFPGVRRTVVSAGRGASSQVVAGDGVEPSWAVPAVLQGIGVPGALPRRPAVSTHPDDGATGLVCHASVLAGMTRHDFVLVPGGGLRGAPTATARGPRLARVPVRWRPSRGGRPAVCHPALRRGAGRPVGHEPGACADERRGATDDREPVGTVALFDLRSPDDERRGWARRAGQRDGRGPQDRPHQSG